MTINTRYNIGDEVWFNTSDGPTCGTIESFTVTKYGIICSLSSEELVEIDWPLDVLFPTKEELIKSL